jgi:hypothetical protein
MRTCLLFAVTTLALSLVAQQPSTQPAAQSTALTIYNEDFAVARTQIDLDLHPGLNEVTTNQVTTQLEPDSVVLRDPAQHDSPKKPTFHIAEQNYDAAVVTQEWLLQKYEGKTIEFQSARNYVVDGKIIPIPDIQAKIIRAPQSGGQYQQNQGLYEVDGKLQFQLPGTPLFPASTDGLLLKPTLRWQIESEKGQKLSAELAYITGGLSWEATYNVIAPNVGEALTEEKADLIGWVAIHNQSGTEFPSARIKLMAGDVAKIAPKNNYGYGSGRSILSAQTVTVNGQVAQKAFDDFHLYDLNRTVSLRDGEIKQIQFIEAAGVALARSYSYDGADGNQNANGYGGNFIQQQNFGLSSDNTKVSILEEFKNSQSNHLGIPLPAGRIRLYRRDADGQMEFVGESTINHTPTEENVKIATGSAFDIKGARRQTDYVIDQSRRMLTESFEIKLTNQKPQPVNVNVLEHLYRGDNWEVTAKSGEYTKLDSHTIQFPVAVPAKAEAKLTYTVHYTW